MTYAAWTDICASKYVQAWNAYAQQIPTWHFGASPSPGIWTGIEYGNAIVKKQWDFIGILQGRSSEVMIQGEIALIKLNASKSITLSQTNSITELILQFSSVGSVTTVCRDPIHF